LTALLAGLIMAFIFRSNIAGPIRRLTDVAERIRGGDLEAQARIESHDETGTLAETFNSMTDKLRQTLQQARMEKKRADDLLDVVIPIGVELTTETDFNQLLESMLLQAKTFCNANAGTLYLRTEDDMLAPMIVRNDVMNVTMGGASGNEITLKSLPLFHPDSGEPNHDALATHVAHTGRLVAVPDADTAAGIAIAGPSALNLETTYDPISYLTLPLKNSRDEVRGVMQLLDAQDLDSGKIIPFDRELQRMMESFSSLAVAALEAYIREQSLKQEIRQLRIEIDEARRQQQVEEIVETDFFQDLQSRARAMRERTRDRRASDPPDAA
jgi:HAMP domain-containing protein